MHSLYLVWHLVRRDFELRYKGSTLGFLWSLAIPLAQLSIISFVFGRVLPSQVENLPLFVFIGLLPWNWFSNSLTAAGGTFLGSKDLLRNPNFDPVVLVLVTVLSNLLVFLLSLPVLVGMLYWYGIGLTWFFPVGLVVLLLIQAILVTGLSLIIASANVFYRDVAHLIGLLVFLLFFVTPIWYSAPETGPYQIYFEINPMSHLVENYRALLMEHGNLDWPGLMMATLISLGFLGVGALTYRRLVPYVFDEV